MSGVFVYNDAWIGQETEILRSEARKVDHMKRELSRLRYTVSASHSYALSSLLFDVGILNDSLLEAAAVFQRFQETVSVADEQARASFDEVTQLAKKVFG